MNELQANSKPLKLQANCMHMCTPLVPGFSGFSHASMAPKRVGAPLLIVFALWLSQLRFSDTVPDLALGLGPAQRRPPSAPGRWPWLRPFLAPLLRRLAPFLPSLFPTEFSFFLSP